MCGKFQGKSFRESLCMNMFNKTTLSYNSNGKSQENTTTNLPLIYRNRNGKFTKGQVKRVVTIHYMLVPCKPNPPLFASPTLVIYWKIYLVKKLLLPERNQFPRFADDKISIISHLFSQLENMCSLKVLCP